MTDDVVPYLTCPLAIYPVFEKQKKKNFSFELIEKKKKNQYLFVPLERVKLFPTVIALTSWGRTAKLPHVCSPPRYGNPTENVLRFKSLAHATLPTQLKLNKNSRKKKE